MCRKRLKSPLDEYRSFNAVAESFFHLLKRDRIRRQTYLIRDAARQDVFDYIERFYNPARKNPTMACCRRLTMK